jgi:hypothetical protein
MPALDRPSGRSHGTYWLGIVTNLLVQVLIVVAVSVAALYYISWSSDAAVAEFVGAFNPSMSDQSPQPARPTQSVKSRTTCFPKT